MNKPPDKKRPDMVSKLKSRKTQQETVVKSSLLKYVKGTLEFKTSFIKSIQSRVLAYSKRINMASLALTHLIQTSYEKVINVWDVDLPDIFNQTFIRQLMLGVQGTSVQNGLKEYFKENPEYLCNENRHYYDSNIYSAGAKKYLTNLKNSFIFNLESRIKQYTKKYQKNYNIKDEVRIAMLYKIFGWNMPDSISKIELSEEISKECNIHRFILGLSNNEIIEPEKILPLKILNYYIYLNRFYESIDETLFNIVPICNIKLHYITIDKSVLYGILKEIKLINCSENDFNALVMDQYHSILRINALQGKQHTFTGTIETDGIILCTHFTHLKVLSKNDSEIKILESDRVVAIDPGRTNIYYAVENKTNRIYKLTRSQYYQESGINLAKKQTETWIKPIQNESILYSQVSTKGCNCLKHQEYFKVYLSVYNVLWDEYTKSRWSRQRFRLYGSKKKVYAKFFNQITNADPTKRVIIAYGNAKFASGGKNEQSVPTSQAFKECSSRFPCKLIDEFRTSKVCYLDDSILKRVGLKGASDKKNWLRGLLWCCSTKISKFISRDLNGAMNILRCALGPRPLALQRKTNQEKIIDVLGKVIKRNVTVLR